MLRRGEKQDRRASQTPRLRASARDDFDRGRLLRGGLCDSSFFLHLGECVLRLPFAFFLLSVLLAVRVFLLLSFLPTFFLSFFKAAWAAA